MKQIICALLVAALCLPGLAESGAAAALLERAGIEADAGLLARVERFVEERTLSKRIIGLMDPALARRYVEHLASDIPIDYSELLDAEAKPLPGDFDISGLRRLAVQVPGGGSMASLLADFERGLIYYDANWPVAEDVCRAGTAAALTPEIAGRLADILKEAALQDWDADYPGDAAAGVALLALETDAGVTRFTVAGISDAPDIVPLTLQALLDAGAAL